MLFVTPCWSQVSLNPQADSNATKKYPILEHKCADHLDTLQIELDKQLEMWREILDGLNIKELDSLQFNQWHE